VLTLQPWGRILGDYRIGREPASNKRVGLSTLTEADRLPRLNLNLQGQTDAEGRFEFPSVPAGEYRIFSLDGSQLSTVTVRSGETTNVRLGGLGRPVRGSFVLSGSEFSVDWTRATSVIERIVTGLQAPDRHDKAAYAAWLVTEHGRAWQRAQRRIGFNVAADGSFRIGDVPAGTYLLNVSVVVESPDSTRHTEELTREFVIPDMPDGRSDMPLDLGLIRLVIKTK
jgi:hypothetical protein